MAQKPSILDSDDVKKLRKEAKTVKNGDLYRALKYVGDDPIKSEIENILVELLDEKTFRKVVAVFNLSTGWKEAR